MRKSKRSNTKKKRSKTPAKRARKYIVKSLFGGDKAAADAWVKENANRSDRGKNYERVRVFFSPGKTKEDISHSLWLSSMKGGDDRRRSAIQKHRKKGNSRTRLPAAFADTEENAFPLLIRRQDRLQSIPTNQTFGLL